jgi:hypothetical protein
MHTLSITLKYRPLRIGWCVSNGDFAGFRSAVRQSFTMWGGRYNPIIPVDDAALAKQLVTQYRVDILIDISGTDATKAFVKVHGHLRNPFHHPLFYPRFHEAEKVAAIVDIQHPIARIYSEHYKNNPNAEAGVDAYHWDDADPLADVMLCTYGAFPPVQEIGVDYLGMIGTALLGRVNPIPNGQELPTRHPGRDTIAGLNRQFLEFDYVVRNHWDHPGFFVGQADDWHDLVMHWNLKAAGIHMLFYDARYEARFAPVRDQWVAQLRAAPARSHGPTGVALWHRRERPLENTDVFGQGLMHCGVGDGTFNGLNLKVPIVLFSRESAQASIGKGYNDKSEIAFSLDKKPFADIEADSQHFVLSVDPGIGLFGNERATLFTPFLPALNEYYGRNIHFDWDKARAEPESLGIITDIRHQHMTMHAVDTSELITQIFKTVGIEAKLSKAGLLCTTLIQQMGGLNGCRAFRIEGVRKLIEDHTPDQSFSRSDAMQTIRGQGSTRPLKDYPMLYFEPRPNGAELTNDAVLGYLLDKGVFRAGLRFQCPSCQLEFWRSLDDAGTKLECEYCGHMFNTSRQLRDKGWAFRRSGLFGNNDHQEGAIPVVLTLQQLMHMHTTSDAFYCGAMEMKSVGAKIENCETDFILVNNQGSERKIQVVIGECKSRNEITEQDVVHLKAVADAFPSDKFSVYVVFAKLVDFTDEEVARIKTLNDDHRMRAIMLTARELEPSFLYERTKQEFDINEIAVSYKDMARVTHLVFFEKRAKQPPEVAAAPATQAAFEVPEHSSAAQPAVGSATEAVDEAEKN